MCRENQTRVVGLLFRESAGRLGGVLISERWRTSFATGGRARLAMVGENEKLRSEKVTVAVAWGGAVGWGGRSHVRRGNAPV